MTAFPRARPVGQQQRQPRRPRVHVFADGGARNHQDVGICTCGSLATDRVHELPETPADAVAIDDRKLGEVETR